MNNYQDIKFKNQELHQKQAAHYEDFANNIFIQLTRLFISLSVFLLTFTSPIFIQITELSELEKTLLFIGWIFLLISIVVGIIQLVIEKRFYEGLAKYYYTIAGLYSSVDNTEKALGEVERKKTEETLRSFRYQSSTIPFAIQVFCFMTGLIFILVVFYKILF